MRSVLATLAAVAFATFAAADGVSSAIAPSQSPPPGCSPNYVGTFNIYPVNTSNSKRDLEGRQHTQLGISLKNGILMDSQGRTGYIASNSQFQFDNPPQAGAIWTAGFSVCQNTRLTLGSDSTWYKCLSGNFFNIYFKNVLSAGQCIESYINTQPVGSGDGPAPVPASLSTAVFSSTTNANGTHFGTTTAMSSSTTMGAANGTANATASVSSSIALSSSITVISGTTSTVVVTGGGGGHTTGRTGGGGGGGQITTSATGGATGGGGGNAAASASSSTSAGGAAAATAGFGSQMFGLAAGLLAFAAI